jgi:hypothetical protein
MTQFATQFLSFNRGLVSPLALARVDLKRLALSADISTNWKPRVLGPMMLRPGLGYVLETHNDAAALHMDFVFDQDDTAICECTDSAMRVIVDDVVVTRPAVTSTFNDWNSGGSVYDPGVLATSTFADATDLGHWHDNDEVGGASTLVSGGGLQLLGTGTAAAIRDRSIAVAGANIGKEHGITIVVVRGQCTLRIGTSEGDDSLLGDRTLRAGTHSIGITPSAAFFIRLSSTLSYACVVSAVTIEQAGGDMVLPTPWLAADLDYIRWDGEGDVIFVGCRDRQSKRIERQDRTSSPPSRSWSVVEYAPTDGPFGKLNTGPVQLKGSALTGEITLTASRNFFKSTHVGGLFRLTSAGQQVSQQITSENTFTNPIKVTGVGTSGRSFQVDLTGPTFTGTTTVTLQRSIAAPGTWSDVATYTGTGSVSIYDNLDNQIAYYRIGVKTGNFTGGDDLTASLTFSAGSINGVVRVAAYTSPTAVSASVLSPLGAANAFTQDWYEGDWSPKNGYPSAVALVDARLLWAGKGFQWLSAVDLLDSFDDTAEGDDITIRRFLGSGPVDKVHWVLALNFALVGTSGRILVDKSSSIDEPLTPVKFSQKPVASKGAAPVRAVPLDTNGVFISRNGSRVFMLSADANLYSIVPYAPTELTELHPEIGVPAFRRIAVQEHKDTQVHLVRGDGKVVIALLDKLEQVTCLLMVETDGEIEDVVVLPGSTSSPVEDQVYYQVKRTIGGVTKRYLEKWSLESQSIGGNDTRLADSHVVYSGAQTTTLSGLSHLEGESVVAWIDGKVSALDDNNDPEQYVVTGGQITVPVAATTFACVGLPYTAQWRSAKIAQGSRLGAPLTQFKNLDHVGFVLANTHALGLSYGQTFDLDGNGNSQLDDMPLLEDGAAVDRDSIWESYDKPSMELDGTWDTDPRICLQAQAPLPCTVMGVVVSGDTHEK